MNVTSKAQVIAAVEKHAPQIMELAKQIENILSWFGNIRPRWLCGALTAAGFEVHRGVAGWIPLRAELGEGELQIALSANTMPAGDRHAFGQPNRYGAAVALAEL